MICHLSSKEQKIIETVVKIIVALPFKMLGGCKDHVVIDENTTSGDETEVVNKHDL